MKITWSGRRIRWNRNGSECHPPGQRVAHHRQSRLCRRISLHCADSPVGHVLEHGLPLMPISAQYSARGSTYEDFAPMGGYNAVEPNICGTGEPLPAICTALPDLAPKAYCPKQIGGHAINATEATADLIGSSNFRAFTDCSPLIGSITTICQTIRPLRRAGRRRFEDQASRRDDLDLYPKDQWPLLSRRQDFSHERTRQRKAKTCARESRSLELVSNFHPRRCNCSKNSQRNVPRTYVAHACYQAHAVNHAQTHLRDPVPVCQSGCNRAS